MTMTSSLKQLTRNVIEKEVFGRLSSSDFKILLADSKAISLLNTVYKTSDLLTRNLLSIEKLELEKRVPHPDVAAIYLLYPSADSIESLISDFSRKPMYSCAFVFSLTHIPEPLFAKLSVPESLNVIFNPNSANMSLMTYQLQGIARRIASFMATLGEIPYIRFHARPSLFSTSLSSAQETVSQKLAFLVQKELESLAKHDPSLFSPRSQKPSPVYPKPILIIADRSLDVLSPLLHDCSYESMVADLLQLQPSGKFFDEKNEKEVLLDESDLIWSQVRHWHIAEVMEYLPQMLRQFTAGNEAAQWELSGNNSNDKIDQIKGVMGSLREYQQFKPLYTLHTDICTKLMQVYNARNISSFDEIEQNVSLADASDTKQIALLLSDAFRVFEDSGVEHLDKLRLMLLCVIGFEGISDSDRQRFLERGHMGPEAIQALTNLGMLHVRLSPALEKNRRGAARNPYSIKEIAKRSSGKQFKFENSKYTPVLKYLVEDQLKHHVDNFVFPWVKEPAPGEIDARPSSWAETTSPSGDLLSPNGGTGQTPSQRKKPSWATRKNVVSTSAITSSSSSSLASRHGGGAQDIDLRVNGPRVIVFVLGGVTYSEIRAVHELRKDHQRDIFLGSTHVWKPDCFVEALKRLHRPNSSGRYMEYQRPAPIPTSSRSQSLQNQPSGSSHPRIAQRSVSRSESAESNTSLRGGVPASRSNSSSSIAAHIPSRSVSSTVSSSDPREGSSSSRRSDREAGRGSASSSRQGSSRDISSSDRRHHGSAHSSSGSLHQGRNDSSGRYVSRGDSRGDGYLVSSNNMVLGKQGERPSHPQRGDSRRHRHGKDPIPEPTQQNGEDNSTLATIGTAASSAANSASVAASQLASSATAFFQTSIAPSFSKLGLSGSDEPPSTGKSNGGRKDADKKSSGSTTGSGVSNWFGFK